MNTKQPKMCPMLPKSASSKQARASRLSIDPQRAATEFERRSPGQKKRREREAKENKPKGSKIVNLRRCVAQRARQQRELATDIEKLLNTRNRGNVRSQAQSLRRKVEEGERRLKSDPICDPSEVLNQALDHEYVMNELRRQDRYRESYRSQMLRYVEQYYH
ncbi:hypothetical protein DFH09DRAFT_1082369 [Mycena vulgaris]|nr:hypothetical protein DFH09DRAFT_1082369 [Mycena vulgaris]